MSPVNTAAFLLEKGGKFVLKERPIPTPGPGEVLIRNHAIGLNPVDWKRQTFGFAIQKYPGIIGTGASTSTLPT